MKTAEIEIYKAFTGYFAWGISGYRMWETGHEDKHLLGYIVRNKLNDNGVTHCVIRPMKNGRPDHYPVEKSELEMIAIAMSFDVAETNLKIKKNEEVYENDR